MSKSVTVILPTLNEGKSIKKIIQDIKELPIDTHIIVADGLSIDQTAAIAMGMGVGVIYKSGGKGLAVREALNHVKTPFVAMIDADCTYPVGVIPQFCGMLNNYDIVKGERRLLEDGAMSKLHKYGNNALSLLASILYGKKVNDVCSGLWVMRCDNVNKFRLTSNGFTLEADLFINTIKTKCRFKEYPIEYYKRTDGNVPKLVITDGLKIAWFLIKKRFTK